MVPEYRDIGASWYFHPLNIVEFLIVASLELLEPKMFYVIFYGRILGIKENVASHTGSHL